MNDKILYEFTRLYNYQDILSKLINGKLNFNYSLTEIHCIEIIGQGVQINVTKLAQIMNITRGAASKITKRLMEHKLVEAFKHPENKKELYFKLTDQGMDIYKQHEIAHKAWVERDINFLETIDLNEREIILSFLTSFNAYLEQLIKEES
nr:MarR family transcriptional regulator [uncultured Anaerocolumna sp.]